MNDSHKSQINISNRSVKDIGIVSGSIVTGDNVSVKQDTGSTQSNEQKGTKLTAAHLVPAILIAIATIIAAIIGFLKPD